MTWVLGLHNYLTSKECLLTLPSTGPCGRSCQCHPSPVAWAACDNGCQNHWRGWKRPGGRFGVSVDVVGPCGFGWIWLKSVVIDCNCSHYNTLKPQWPLFLKVTPPPKTRPFPIKTRVPIWVLGLSIFLYFNFKFLRCTCEWSCGFGTSVQVGPIEWNDPRWLEGHCW